VPDWERKKLKKSSSLKKQKSTFVGKENSGKRAGLNRVGEVLDVRRNSHIFIWDRQVAGIKSDIQDSSGVGGNPKLQRGSKKVVHQKNPEQKIKSFLSAYKKEGI